AVRNRAPRRVRSAQATRAQGRTPAPGARPRATRARTPAPRAGHGRAARDQVSRAARRRQAASVRPGRDRGHDGPGDRQHAGPQRQHRVRTPSIGATAVPAGGGSAALHRAEGANMEPLDSRAREILQRYTAEISPSAAEARTQWEAIEARLARGDV